MNCADSLLTWLTTATLRGSALVGVVLLLQWALGRWMPGRWRLALWLPVVLVMAAPLLPECRWSMESSVVGQVANSTWCCPAGSRDCGLGSNPSLVGPVSDRARMGWSIIAGCWVLGGLWFLGVVWWSYGRAMKQLRMSATAPDAAVTALLREAADVTGARWLPEVLMSDRVSSPAVAGVWRPTLLLPDTFPRGLSDDEACLVLQHELTHIRRRDLWKNWALCLLQAVHWFNPVAWLAVNRMRADCERACDEEVLARNGSDCFVRYGHALIKVASGCGAAELQLGMLRMAASPEGLRRRLRGIANARRVHPAWTAMWFCLIAVVMLAGATRSPGGLPQGVSFFGGGPSAAVTRAQGVRLPQVELRGASLGQAVEEVQRLARVSDPKGRGIRVWVTPEAAANAQGKRISLSLRNVSVWQALSVITDRVSVGMDGSGDVICVKWPFVSLTWLVADKQVRTLGGEAGVRKWLVREGVQFPAGSALQLNEAVTSSEVPQMQRLTVRNSQENLRRVSALLSGGSNGAN